MQVRSISCIARLCRPLPTTAQNDIKNYGLSKEIVNRNPRLVISNSFWNLSYHSFIASFCGWWICQSFEIDVENWLWYSFSHVSWIFSYNVLDLASRITTEKRSYQWRSKFVLFSHLHCKKTTHYSTRFKTSL